jgi:hypothetical protein
MKFKLPVTQQEVCLPQAFLMGSAQQQERFIVGRRIRVPQAFRSLDRIRD